MRWLNEKKESLFVVITNFNAEFAGKCLLTTCS